MADPADLLRAWQHAIGDLGAIAASLASGPAGAASDLVRPLQHQAELLQQVLQRQLEFERELVGRAAAPLHAAQDLVDQATGTFRAQATSFRAASTTFGQLAGLMDQQADLLERAGTLMRDPLTAGGPSSHEKRVSWSSPWWLVVRVNGWSGLGRRFESVANCGVVAARSLRCAGVGRMIVAA